MNWVEQPKGHTNLIRKKTLQGISGDGKTNDSKKTSKKRAEKGYVVEV